MYSPETTLKTITKDHYNPSDRAQRLVAHAQLLEHACEGGYSDSQKIIYIANAVAELCRGRAYEDG